MPAVRALLATVLIATTGTIAASAAGVFTGLSGEAHDALIVARNHGRPAPKNVVLIDVDPATVAAHDGKIPLPRALYGRAIRRLDQLGARAAAIDVQFTTPSKYGNGDDEALFDAAQQTKLPVVFATSEALPNGDTTVLGGRKNLDAIGAVAGHSSVPLDADGTIRRLDRTIDGVPSFSQATARAIGAPGLPGKQALLDPTAPASKLDTVSFQQLISGHVDPRLVRGRVAVIGWSAVSPTGDDFKRVTGSADRVFGFQLQAQAIDTVLRGAPLHDGGRLAAWLLALFSGALIALAARRTMRTHLAGVVVSAAAAVAVAYLAVRAGLLIDPVPALFAVVTAAIGTAAVRAAAERQRRVQARATLARFVPPGVVDEVLDGSPDGHLAPRAQTATVVFCDLRGYTKLVAQLADPADLLAVLGAYLETVTETIHAHGGTVVSFQGDGVMSAFGVPVPSEQAAAQAVAAAHALQADALPKIRAQLRAVLPEADGLALGIGIATGPVFAGTVGPAARREYAVVGPTTNLAARLQTLTKTEGVGVLTDDATAEAVARAEIAAEPTADLCTRGAREIRGLPQPIRVWAVSA